jgi:hypothetical protein
VSYPAKVTTSIRDGQLALGSTPEEVPLIVGVSQSGTVATLYHYTDGNTALDALGLGPLTEVGLPVLEAAGGALFLKLTGSVAATNSAVTATRIGSSVGTVTLSGSVYRDSRCIILITSTTAALGSGKFKFSLDNGNTYSEEITIPSGGTYTFPGTNLTATFNLQSGTPDFEAGDRHTWTSTCAHWNTTNLSAGITALLASTLLNGRRIRKVYWTGIPADAATAATNAAAIATHMATLQARNHFARSLMDCGSIDTTSNVLANYVAAFADTRVAACYGRCEMTSPAADAGFGLPFVSILQPVAVRATQAEISENLGRQSSGPLRGVKATTLSADEFVAQAFTRDNKITTLRTEESKSGEVFVTFGFLKSPAGSDFLAWDYGVTLDSACQALVDALSQWTLRKLRVVPDGTGFLDPRDAARVRQSCMSAVSSVLDQPTKDGADSHVSGWDVTIATQYNFISDPVIKATLRIVPSPAAEGAELVVGLVRQLEAA